MEKRIIITTNALTDILLETSEDELNRLGLKKGQHTSMEKVDRALFTKLVATKKLKTFLGGGPANTARGIKHLGLGCSIIGAVGDDIEGKRYIKTLEEEKIKPFFNIYAGKESGKCFVFITPDGERSFVANKGVYPYFPKIDPSKLEHYNLFHTSGYELVSNSEQIINFTSSIKKFGTKISFDVASELMIKKCPDKFKEIIKSSDIIFANEEEVAVLNDLSRNLNEMQVLCLKKGKYGSEIYHQGQKMEILPVRTQRLINTNGAGDSYAAGFLFSYLLGNPLKKCGDYGSLIASKVCSQEESWYKGN